VALGAILVFAFVIAVDPYDSGRLGLLHVTGTTDRNLRTANASRARNPQFDSAIIGNSHGLNLKPGELSQATDFHFVQLSIQATTAREQLAMLDFFMQHHQRIGALVIVTDEVWCTHDPALPTTRPFPFWLYGGTTFDYALRLFSVHGISTAFGRVMIGLGLRKGNDPEGTNTYEEPGLPRFNPVIPAETSPQQAAPAPAGKVNDFFPAVAQLEARIRQLPTEVSLVFVAPPFFYPELPRPGSVEAAEQEACHAALRRLVAGRPHSIFIDYHIDAALTRDPANFLNADHYRAKIARKMEEGIIASLRLGNGAKIDF
jgi:hypothetical protein